MRPIAAVTLIVLGSCFAIMVSLAAVIVIVLVLGDEYPRLQREFEPLFESLGVFVGMTVISAASFYGLIKNHPFRFVGQGAMWLGLLLTGWYFWP
jgi:hypothetical protein